MKKINEMINIIILLLGFCILLISFFLDDNTKQICNSIATSLIASAIVAFLSSRYIIKQNKISDIINEWNIAGIYETRSKMNDESSNIYLDKLKNEMDIISLGMRSFRDAKGALIEEKVKHGIKLRILTLNNELFKSEKNVPFSPSTPIYKSVVRVLKAISFKFDDVKIALPVISNFLFSLVLSLIPFIELDK